MLYWIWGKYDRAEPLLTSALEDAGRVYGSDHRETLTIMHNLALLYASQGKPKQAEELFSKALDGRVRAIYRCHQPCGYAHDALPLIEICNWCRRGEHRSCQGEGTIE